MVARSREAGRLGTRTMGFRHATRIVINILTRQIRNSRPTHRTSSCHSRYLSFHERNNVTGHTENEIRLPTTAYYESDEVKKKSRATRATLGSVIAIPLPDGTCGYGRVLRDPLVAFYDLQSTHILPMQDVMAAGVAFTLFVMKRALMSGRWPVIGDAPLTPELQEKPLFFKRDMISGALSIYRASTGKETRATREECRSVECAAVWDPEHIVERLQDHFAGQANKWTESMRP